MAKRSFFAPFMPLYNADGAFEGDSGCHPLQNFFSKKNEATCNPRVGLQIAFMFIRLQASF